MHIKKVVIEGFKSYRNKTILDFGPGLNVIVGRNGAGKTNLFSAIQFVLCHEFHHLAPRQRENILHSSSGLRATSAYVEIIFDNEDRRFPEEGNELRLRREVTSKTDTYFLNNHTITKEQVLNTLQSAGLSKANPYYIIKQGRINDLAMASDEKRLAMLTEVAGSLVWKELRPADNTMLKDAEIQLDVLENYLREMEDNLTTLEKEEQEYRHWQLIGTRKRALEALLWSKEHANYAKRLAYLRKQLSDALSKETIVSAELERREADVTEAETLTESYQAEFRSAQDKLINLTDMVQELTVEHSKLELELSDSRKSSNDSTNRPADDAESMQQDLSSLEDEIRLKRMELSSKLKELDGFVQVELQFSNDLFLKEQRRKQLYAKLGREQMFDSLIERDQWIREEQGTLNELVEQEELQLDNVSREIEKEQSIAEQLQKEISVLEEEKRSALQSLMALKKQKDVLKLEQRKFQMLRSEIWRKEREIQEQLQEAVNFMGEATRRFRFKVPKTLIDGMESIAFILQKMRAEGEESFAFKTASAYRGLIIDQFTCDPEVNIAVGAVAGNRLFYHVVDTDTDAAEIIRRANNEKLPGTFNMYAINRLLSKSNPAIPNVEAVPLIDVLTIKRGMTKVMEQVFGRVLLCRDLNTGLSLARQLNMDCVTFEGDLVRNNGPLTGGYLDPNHSASLLYNKWVEAQALEANQRFKLNEIQEQKRMIDAQCNNTANDLQKVELKISQTCIGSIEQHLMKNRRSLSASMSILEGMREVPSKLNMSLEANRSKIRALDQELQQGFASELSFEEREEVELLNQEIQMNTPLFKDATAKRMEAERSINLIDSQLKDNLLKRKADLEKCIQEKSFSFNLSEGNLEILREMEGHLGTLQTRLTLSRSETGTLENTISELSKKLAKAENELGKSKNRRQQQQEALNEERNNSEKLLDAIRRNEDAEKSSMEKMIECGTFLTDDEKKIYDEYSQFSAKDLKAQLTLVNNDHAKSSKDINQKAAVYCTFIKDNLNDMIDQLNSLTVHHEECNELVVNVDSQKNEAIQYSLKQVARSFRTMFRTIVPRPARGYLKWIYDDDDSDESDEESDEDCEPREPDANRLKGVAVKVSFSGGSNVRNLTSLSGGQRSVVSMALVFAILMMDRAPFYLLDEADMALDTRYRRTIAAMVERFAERSQFIATTFRPELLAHVEDTDIIGVTYDPLTQTSHASSISKEEAVDFLSSNGSTSSSSSRASSQK